MDRNRIARTRRKRHDRPRRRVRAVELTAAWIAVWIFFGVLNLLFEEGTRPAASAKAKLMALNLHHLRRQWCTLLNPPPESSLRLLEKISMGSDQADTTQGNLPTPLALGEAAPGHGMDHEHEDTHNMTRKGTIGRMSYLSMRARPGIGLYLVALPQPALRVWSAQHVRNSTNPKGDDLRQGLASPSTTKTTTVARSHHHCCTIRNEPRRTEEEPPVPHLELVAEVQMGWHPQRHSPATNPPGAPATPTATTPTRAPTTPR